MNDLPKPLRSVDAFWSASRALGRSSETGSDAATFFVVDGRIDRLRLVAGDYVTRTAAGKGDAPELIDVRTPYFHYTRHFDRLHRTDARCSAGPFARFRDRRDPCAGCDLYWSTIERSTPGRRSSPRMTKTAQYVFTAVDHGAYHPRRGRSLAAGAPGMKCLGAECRACAAGAPAQPGQTVSWDLGWKDLQLLRAAERAIGRASPRAARRGSRLSRGSALRAARRSPTCARSPRPTTSCSSSRRRSTAAAPAATPPGCRRSSSATRAPPQDAPPAAPRSSTSTSR
jgi:hypothetical protein